MGCLIISQFSENVWIFSIPGCRLLYIYIYIHKLYIILNITQAAQATTTTTFFLSTFKLKPLRTQLLTMSCHFVCVMIDHCPVHGTFTWNGPASIRILSEICASAFRAGRFDTEQQNKKLRCNVQWHDTLPVRACLDMPGIDLELSTSDPNCSDACYSPIS